MGNLLFLGNLVWFLVGILFLFLHKRKKHKEVTARIEEIKRLSRTQGEGMRILFMDYKDPAFKKIDSLLSASADVPGTIVVIHAPSWLIAAREKKWAAHEVIDGSRIPSSNRSGMIVTRGDGYDIYDEAAAYLAYVSS
ncbi:hypothetical protein [Paenibacillus sp. 1P03SA]|uniref:hypothetical protein n=1 Tax=Paenibacillus sp. 1P03SA TaxID=3132294 RepID=UPI00399F77A9